MAARPKLQSGNVQTFRQRIANDDPNNTILGNIPEENPVSKCRLSRNQRILPTFGVGNHRHVRHINKDLIHMNGNRLIPIIFRPLGNVAYAIAAFFICSTSLYRSCGEAVARMAVDLLGDDPVG